MSSKFEAFLKLKKLLLMMEADLGIGSLKQEERDLLAAIIDIQNLDGTFETENLRSHPLAIGMSHGTFFRALRSLRENNFIDKQIGRQRGLYQLIMQPSQDT